MKHVVSIAGTDPSGGAGAAADCKTFCAHGCYAMNVITGAYGVDSGMVEVVDADNLTVIKSYPVAFFPVG